MGKSHTGVMCVCGTKKKKIAKRTSVKRPSDTYIVCGVQAANPICPVCGPRTGRFPSTMGTTTATRGGRKKIKIIEIHVNPPVDAHTKS